MINVKVLEEKENKVLKRKDLLLMLDHKGEATPSESKATEIIKDKFKADPKKTEIVYMFSEKGKPATKVKAFVWDKKIVEKKEEKKEEKPKEESEKEEKTEKPEKEAEKTKKEKKEEKKEEKSEEKKESEEKTNKSEEQKQKGG